MKVVSGFMKKSAVIILGLVMVMAIVGWLWIYPAIDGQILKSTSTPSPYETSSVRTGNIVIAATGNGTLISRNVVDLSFPISGTVSQLNVQLGDQVKAGDVLAILDGLDELDTTVQTRKLELEKAQKNLDELLNSKDENLAQSLLDLSKAQSDLADAKKSLVKKGVQRCDNATMEKYFYQNLDDQSLVNTWQSYLSGGSGYGTNYILTKLVSLRENSYQSAINLAYCEGYTTREIQESEANYQLAEATEKQVEAAYQKLKESDGLDKEAVALAEVELKNAQLQLLTAENNLTGATMVAPMDGTIIELNGKAGEAADTSTFLTIANMKSPSLEASIDQSDMQNLKVNCPADIDFDAISGRTFTGKVSEIAPATIESDGSSSLLAYIQMDDVSLPGWSSLPWGLSATVDVICQQVNNVLIIPTEALYTVDGKQVVYVLSSSGQPEKREVEVGLSDSIFVEIRQGVKLGEQVITSGL